MTSIFSTIRVIKTYCVIVTIRMPRTERYSSRAQKFLYGDQPLWRGVIRSKLNEESFDFYGINFKRKIQPLISNYFFLKQQL